MNKKNISILLVVLLISIGILACNKSQGLPTTLALEDSIREIILSKGENYDFLRDELYLSKMDELISILANDDIISKKQYRIDNLDKDNIPEIIIFKERNQEDIDDQGFLEVYKYISQRYILIDKAPMNYDNTNYELLTGNISIDQKGILLNNQAGSQSGVTYGFILDKGKLINVLNEKKINLVSINSSGRIMDIDNDGILEFSVYTVDPESIDQSVESSDKITYWYKWNGNDSANLVKYHKAKDTNFHNSKMSDPEILKTAKDMLTSNESELLQYIKDNKELLSINDTSSILRDYIYLLEDESDKRENIINDFFSKYQVENNDDYLLNKYGLSLERLNDLKYLGREKILSSEIELKGLLIENLNRGYKLSQISEKYIYMVDYQSLIDMFGDSILKEYRDFYKILAISQSNLFKKNNELIAPMEKLAEIIVQIDDFKITYPYSEFISKLDLLYEDYLNSFLYEVTKNPILSRSIAEKYPKTYLSDIILNMLESFQKKEV